MNNNKLDYEKMFCSDIKTKESVLNFFENDNAQTARIKYCLQNMLEVASRVEVTRTRIKHAASPVVISEYKWRVYGEDGARLGKDFVCGHRPIPDSDRTAKGFEMRKWCVDVIDFDLRAKMGVL